MFFGGPPSRRRKHNLGNWVVTREDALQESYALYNWYKGTQEEAWEILVNLANTLDEDKEEDYVDPKFTED